MTPLDVLGIRDEVSMLLVISLFICVAFFIVYSIIETVSILASHHKMNRSLDSILETLVIFKCENYYVDNDVDDECIKEDFQGSFSTSTNKKE